MTANTPSKEGNTYSSNRTIFLTERELAQRWKQSPRTLQNQRLIGGGVPYVKLGASVRYRLDAIEAYERSRLHESTSDMVVDQRGVDEC